MLRSRGSNSLRRWTLMLVVLCSIIATGNGDDREDVGSFYNPQQSSYARVQYAHDKPNNTRRYNIHRDPTIQYVSFDELYNKYSNDQSSNSNKGSPATFGNKNSDTVILGSSQMSSVSVTTSGGQDRTPSPSNPSEINDNNPLGKVHSEMPIPDGQRRWEDVPDLTNGWTVERGTPTTTAVQTTSTDPPPKTAAYNDRPSSPTFNTGVDRMYAYSTAYQNYESDKFNKVSVDRTGALPSSTTMTTTTTTEHVVPSTTSKSSTTSTTHTANDNFVGAAAEYAHAIGEENYASSVVDRTSSSTNQPVVMEASWTERRPTSPKTVVRTQSGIQDRADSNPSNMVEVSVQGPPGYSLVEDGVQSAWRPFMGPAIAQVNPKMTKLPQMQKVSTSETTTTSPMSTIRVDRTTAGTLFYNEAANKASTSTIRFPDDSNFGGNNDQLKRRPQVQPFNIPSGQPAQQGGIQILMIPNMDENEIKGPVQPLFPQAGGSLQPPGMRFPPERPQGQPGFQLNPNGQPMFSNQQPSFPGVSQPNQNRPLQFDRPNETKDQQPPHFGQPNDERLPPFGQPNDERLPQFGQPSIRPLRFGPQNPQGDQRPLQPQPQFQRPPQFVPSNIQNNIPRPNLPQNGAFPPNRDQMRPEGHFDRFTTAASNGEGSFISGIPNPQGSNRIPSGPVGLPPQLIPQLQSRPTDAQNQGGTSINIPLPLPRPTGAIGTSINNPLPGPPIPLPGVPSGPIVIGNLPNGNTNNNDDRNRPNGSFRPNFQPPVLPDRIDDLHNQENFIQQQPPHGQGPLGQMNQNVPLNFRPPNFPPRGPPTQASSSPSLLKSLFSKFFPFARSLNDDGVPIVDSDSLINGTTLVVDPSIYETIARSAGNSSEPYVINIESFLTDYEPVATLSQSNVTSLLSTTEVYNTKETESTSAQSMTKNDTMTTEEVTTSDH